jgi:hypothetical protein
MNHDWLPGSRTEQLTMARNWLTVITAEKAAAWGIPAAKMTELAALTGDAAAVLDKAQSGSERTPVVTSQCGAAFKTLEAKLRFFKKHYLLLPPLTTADLVSLGLKPDTVQTPIPAPDAQATASIGFADAHLIDVRDIRPRLGHSTDERSDWAVDIRIGIVDGAGPFRIDAPPGPGTGSRLPFAMTTRRRRERFDLEGSSGKTAWFSLAFRNKKGQLGPFCPPFAATVP